MPFSLYAYYADFAADDCCLPALATCYYFLFFFSAYFSLLMLFHGDCHAAVTLRRHALIDYAVDY